MKPSTAKSKGVETENEFVRFLLENGVPRAERRRLSGALDKGDISGWNASDNSWNVVVEVKSGAHLNPQQWLRELSAEMANAGAEMGFVAVRPKGKPRAEDWFGLVPIPLFMELMAKAGYIQ